MGRKTQVILSVRNLNFSIGKREILKNVNLDVQAGEIVAIIGPSGSGKSTLLRCINHLDSAQGEVLIENERVLESNANKMRQKASMVFQHFNLFANLSVLENLTIAPVKTGLLSKSKAEEDGKELLDRIGLLEKAYSNVKDLSGGQKQRVAIVRSLMMSPRIILFDEPTSALDPEMVGEILELMETLAKDKLTMLIVTHEIPFIEKVASRIVFIENGQILSDEPIKKDREYKNERLKEYLCKVLH